MFSTDSVSSFDSMVESGFYSFSPKDFFEVLILDLDPHRSVSGPRHSDNKNQKEIRFLLGEHVFQIIKMFRLPFTAAILPETFRPAPSKTTHCDVVSLSSTC